VGSGETGLTIDATWVPFYDMLDKLLLPLFGPFLFGEMAGL